MWAYSIITMNKLYFVLLIISSIACKHAATIHPQKKDIVETVYASGKIIADSEYSVYALSPGTIVKKLIREGDSVKANQILYLIKHDAQNAKLDAAQNAYSIAQTNLSEQSRILNDLKIAVETAGTKLINDSLQYFRLLNLWKENIGTKSALDNAYNAYVISQNQKKSAIEKYHATQNDLKVTLNNLHSQLSAAQNDLDNYYIKSSNAGTIYKTYKEEGEAVKANDVMAMIGKTNNRIIKLAIDQQDIDRVKIGQEVLLKIDVTGNTVYTATIQRIYPTMNEADQTFRVDAVFKQSANQPFIHSSVEANIIIQKKNQVLVVPRNAVLNNDSLKIKENGEIKTIAVKTGIKTLNDVEVLNGLSENSEIIIPTIK